MAGANAVERRAGGTRSARKRRAIIEAATDLLLRKGYQGTSMDEIAALAAVSKQTIYKQFSDKEALFTGIIRGIADRAGGFVDTVTRTLRHTDDVERDLRALAREYLAIVMEPGQLQVRRLLIEEAGRHPELARGYYRQVPERTLAALAACFQDLDGRGLLRVDDPELAATHFAFLILGKPLDRAMLCGDDERLAADIDRIADAGVRVFLAAYGVR